MDELKERIDLINIEDEMYEHTSIIRCLLLEERFQMLEMD